MHAVLHFRNRFLCWRSCLSSGHRFSRFSAQIGLDGIDRQPRPLRYFPIAKPRAVKPVYRVPLLIRHLVLLHQSIKKTPSSLKKAPTRLIQFSIPSAVSREPVISGRILWCFSCRPVRRYTRRSHGCCGRPSICSWPQTPLCCTQGP